MARTRTTVSKLIHGVEPYKPAKGEEYLNSPQQTHFRNILEAWRDELLVGSSKTVSSMQDETINHPDPTDRASQETEISLELRSRDRERKLLKKINESLDTLEAGDYGFCDKCGIEIGLKRLEARPTATLCIDCKTLQEIRERNLA